MHVRTSLRNHSVACMCASISVDSCACGFKSVMCAQMYVCVRRRCVCHLIVSVMCVGCVCVRVYAYVSVRVCMRVCVCVCVCGRKAECLW